MRTFFSVLLSARRLGLQRATCITNGAMGGGNGSNHRDHILSVKVLPDSRGLIGMECPSCQQHFRIKPDTVGEGQRYCPYCGQCDGKGAFVTKSQRDHIQPAVKNVARNIVRNELAKSLRRIPGVRVSRSLAKRMPPQKETLYQEIDRKMQSTIVCQHCKAHFEVDSQPGFCPNCGKPPAAC